MSMFVSLEECLEGYEARLNREENNFEEDNFVRASFEAIPKENSGDVFDNFFMEYHKILREGWDGSVTITRYRY